MTGGLGPELAVVIPVYNEAASIERVVKEWWSELEEHAKSFRVLVLDDGSTDATPRILERLSAERGARLVVERTTNRGHGQACLAGYRWAQRAGATYVLQIDSDGQCDPRYFGRLWSLRNEAPVVYGKRVRRDDGLGRVLASKVLRLVVRLVTGARCADPNVPYRLMQTGVVAPLVERVPVNFELANVALAVLLSLALVPERSTPIRFCSRYGGVSSLRPLGFLVKAVRLVTQLRRLEVSGAVPLPRTVEH